MGGRSSSFRAKKSGGMTKQKSRAQVTLEKKKN